MNVADSFLTRVARNQL